MMMMTGMMMRMERVFERFFLETKSIFTICVDGDGDCGGNAIVETFTLDLEWFKIDDDDVNQTSFCSIFEDTKSSYTIGIRAVTCFGACGEYRSLSAHWEQNFGLSEKSQKML